MTAATAAAGLCDSLEDEEEEGGGDGSEPAEPVDALHAAPDVTQWKIHGCSAASVSAKDGERQRERDHLSLASTDATPHPETTRNDGERL